MGFGEEGFGLGSFGSTSDTALDGPKVMAALATGRRTVRVTLDQTVTAGGSVAADWSLVPLNEMGVPTDRFADSPDVASVAFGTLIATLTLATDLTPGAAYQVTAPLALINGDGVTLDPNARTASFLWVPATAPAKAPKEGILQALLSTMGAAFANLSGTPTTRLTQPLAYNDDHAHVESAYGSPDSGIIYVQGERIPYASKTATEYRGLVRETLTVDPTPYSAALGALSFPYTPPLHSFIGQLRISLGAQAGSVSRNFVVHGILRVAYGGKNVGDADTETITVDSADSADSVRDWAKITLIELSGGVLTGNATLEVVTTPVTVYTNICFYGPYAPPWPAKTVVQDASRQWGTADQSLGDTMLDRATSFSLLGLAADMGFPRPIPAMSVDQTREYVRTQWYLDRTTWWAAFRVLKAMFAFTARSGGDASAFTSCGTLWIQGADIPEPTNTLHDRWIYINGRLCRVIRSAYAPGGLPALQIEPASGPFWQAPLLTNGQTGIAWTLVPFRICQDIGGERYDAAGTSLGLEGAGSIRIYLYVTTSAEPFTYLKGDRTLTTDGRPHAGKLYGTGDPTSADKATREAGGHGLSGWRWPLFLIAPYRAITTTILTNVLAAGTRIKVIALAAD